jgi:hypothetical protein
MKKKPKKLKLAAETLRVLTPGKGQVVGGLSEATDCYTCLGTCRTDCGSCGDCTQYPCPITDALSCPC